MLISIVLLICLHPSVCQVQPRPRIVPRAQSVQRSSLTGVYRIDMAASDRLYSVVADASTNLPLREQQRFFIDLAVRLTPPDLLAIEHNGNRISLGSSRAPRMNLVADGVVHNTTEADGHIVRARLSLENTAGLATGNERLVFTSSGRTEDNFSVIFEAIDNGNRMRVVRRIAAEGLDQPLVIKTIYNKISDVARWEVYGEPQVAATSPRLNSATSPNPSAGAPQPPPIRLEAQRVAAAVDPSAADVLRGQLNGWLAATNNREINQQMSFYVPRLTRFYLKSNATRGFVREEKARVFASAKVIDIRAEEPEIIFQDGGRTAVMRYRKKYRVENGRQSRRGEVIQELRWRLMENEWRIFSERDIRVLN